MKVLLPREAQRDPAAAERFAREIRVLAALRHPNVVKLVDHGEDEVLGPYLVMPFVEGVTLRELAATTKLWPEAVLLLLAEILAGLAMVHDAGLVHRDLKPENILFSPTGRVTIVDFGLALGELHSRHTAEGAVTGSVPYLSPERIEGRASGPASDVWALGVIAFELLAGKRPFQRATPSEEVSAILGGARASLRRLGGVRVPGAFAEMLERCLSPAPAERPDSAELLRSVLAQIDWAPSAQIPAELERLARDPEAYRRELGELLAARLRRGAEEAIARGDSFAAIEQLDRALALRPDDEALSALLDRASSLSPQPAPRTPAGAETPTPQPAPGASAEATTAPPQPAPRAPAEASARDAGAPEGERRPAATPRRTQRTAIVAALVSIVAVSSGVLYLTTRSTGAPPAATAGSAVSAPSADTAAPTAAPEPPATQAPAPSVRVVIPPFPELELLPIEALSNTDPPQPPKNVAAPGEPLVPANLLGPGGPAAALASLDAQLASKPGDPELRVGRALVLVGNGRLDEGLRELDEVGREHPDMALVWASKAYLDLRRNRLDDAERSFSRAIELDPKDATALRNRGILRRARGRTRDAYLDLLEALRHRPDDVEALKELAGMYDEKGRRSGAVPLLERVLRVRPRDASIWIDLSIAQDDLDQSLASARKALALAPAMPRAHQRLCAVLSRKESAEAIPACTRALELSPDDARSLNNRAMAYYHLGQDAKALTDLDRAVELAPDWPGHRTNRYLVRTHAGKTKAALDDLRAACRLGSQAACAELEREVDGGSP